MNKDNKVLNDNEIENVSGGTDVGGVCGFNKTTIDGVNKNVTPDTKGEESTAYKVGIFPGLSGFP